MITLARIIEAWRDAQIFKNPTAPRGFWWHVLKYPQFGGMWTFAGVIVIDILLAWAVFEFFLRRFRD